MKIKAVVASAVLLGVCTVSAFAFTLADCPHYSTSIDANGICHPSNVAPMMALEKNVAAAEAALAAAKAKLVEGKAAYAAGLKADPGVGAGAGVSLGGAGNGSGGKLKCPHNQVLCGKNNAFCCNANGGLSDDKPKEVPTK